VRQQNALFAPTEETIVRSRKKIFQLSIPVVIAAGILLSLFLVTSPRGYIAGIVLCPAPGTIHIAVFDGITDTGFPAGKRLGGTFLPHEGPYVLRNLPVALDIYIFATLDADGSGGISDGDFYGSFEGAPLRLSTEGFENADIRMRPLSSNGAPLQIPSKEKFFEPGRSAEISGEKVRPGKSSPASVSVSSSPARLHYRKIRTWEVGEGLSLPGGDPFAPFRRFVPFLALIFLSGGILIAINIFLHFRFRGISTETAGGYAADDDRVDPLRREDVASSGRSGLPAAAAAIGIILAAALLRLLHLDAESLEHLEATYLLGGSAAPSLFWSFFSRVGIDQGHQPLYHGILYLWSKITGSSLAAGRLFSALAGLGTLPLLFFFGKRIAGRNEALLAILLLAVAPLHVWYSRDLTPYTWMALFSLANYYFLYSAGESGRSRHLAGYLVSGALLFYTHYFGVGIIVAGFCYTAINLFDSRGDPARRNRWIRVAAASALLLVIILAWFPMFAETNRVQQYIHSCERDIKRPATPFEGRAILGLFFGSGSETVWPLFILLPISAAAFYHVFRTRRRLFLLVFPPLLVCAGMNLVYWKMTHFHNKGLASNEIRHSLDMLPYLHLILAAWVVDTFKTARDGISRSRPQESREGPGHGIIRSGPKTLLTRITSAGVVILLLALNGNWLVSLLDAPVKSDIRGACNHVRNGLRDGDAVAVLPIFFYSHQGIYHLLDGEEADFRGLMAAPAWHPLPGEGEYFAVLSDFDLPYTDALSSLFFDRLWIIDIRDRLFGAEVFSSRSAEFVLAWLESGADLVETAEYNNVKVHLFEGPVEGAGRGAWKEGVFKLTPGENDYPYIKGVWPSTVFKYRGRFLTEGTVVAVPREAMEMRRNAPKVLHITGKSSSLHPQNLEIFVQGSERPIGTCKFAAGEPRTCSFKLPPGWCGRSADPAEPAREEKSDRMFLYLESEMEYNDEAERPLGIWLAGLSIRSSPAGR